MLGIFRKNKDGLGGAFFLTLACFVFTYLVFGFYYVEYEALHNSFLSGKLTPGVPFRSIYFLMHLGTSHIYSLLYEYFPGIEWISWILYAHCFFACLLALYIIRTLVPPHRPWWAVPVWQVLVYLFVFADHNVHFIFTRVCYITVGVSLIGLVYFFDSVKKIKERPLLFLALNLLFTLGALCRIESSVALVALLFVFSWAYLHRIKQSILLFLYPGVLLGAFVLAISHDIKTSTEFYKQIEPDIEVQFVERQNKIPLSEMETAEDSIKYKMAAAIAWVDPSVITPEFMRSMIREEGPMYTDIRQWKRVWGDVSGVVATHWAFSLFSVILGILILTGVPANQRARWAIYMVLFWVYLFVQAYTFKINSRSFLPNVSVVVFGQLLVLIRVLYQGSRPGWRYVFFVTVVVFAVLQVNDIWKESRILRADLADYRHNTDRIRQAAHGKYLVVNSSSFDYVFSSHKPFVPFDYSAFKRIYITDGYNIPFLPYYRRYLENECRCDMADFPGFWDYLKSVRSEVVIMSTPDRMQLLREYMKVIYGYPLSLEEVGSEPLLRLRKSDYRDVFFDLKMYQIKADTTQS